MPWIPRAEYYYNERVPQFATVALGMEYEQFSIPEALTHPGVYKSVTWGDVQSDSLFFLPRMQNYAENIQAYFDRVVAAEEEKQP